MSTAPAPGQAPLPAPDAAALLRSNAADPEVAARPAVRFGGRTWTHGEYGAESARWAQLFLSRHRGGDRPLHVGVLLDNTPDYLFALGGAALSGSTVVGLNHTRVGEHLARDVTHTDVDLLVTEPGHWDDLAPVLPLVGDLPVLVSSRFPRDGDPEPPAGAQDLDAALAAVPATDPGCSPGPEARWALIFTSGTSSAPKAVVCTQRRLLVTGNRMRMMLGLGPDDVGLRLHAAVPLQRTHGGVGAVAGGRLLGGAGPALLGLGLAARRASPRRHLLQLHGQAAVLPGRHPRTARRRRQPRAHRLRQRGLARGDRRVPDTVRGGGDRRLRLDRGRASRSTGTPRPRPGAMGVAGDAIRIVAEDGTECPPARFGPDGSLLNAEECVGEIVNTAGSGPFEGYYNNDEATAAATRGGWYWSGDLGYLDDDRFLFFAGRTSDWIRVDGENFPAGPIDEALSRSPDVVLAVAYGVPDVHAGDQVMAAVVVRDGAAFDPGGSPGGSTTGPAWGPSGAPATSGWRNGSRPPAPTRW